MADVAQEISKRLTHEFRTGKLVDAAYGYQMAVILDIWTGIGDRAYLRAKQLGEQAANKATTRFVEAFAAAAGQLAAEFPDLQLRQDPKLPKVDNPPRRGEWIREDYSFEGRTKWHRAGGDLGVRRTPAVVTVEARTVCNQKMIDLARSDEWARPILRSTEPPRQGLICARCLQWPGKRGAR